MAGSLRTGLGSALAWFFFPAVSTALASFFYRAGNLGGSDPRQWGALTFFIMLGPLGGFAYLAGATVDLPDTPAPRGWRWLLSIPRRRAVWVALGPWFGFFLLFCLELLMVGLAEILARVASPERIEAWRRVFQPGDMGLPPDWVFLIMFGIGSYGWLIIAFAASIRARRRGRLLASMKLGLLTAIGFLGSLIGGFWAATSAFRAYFFDPRVVPLILFSLILLGTSSGCSSTTTVGDLRRRELFEALTAAWVLGLALVWRWLGRERKP